VTKPIIDHTVVRRWNAQHPDEKVLVWVSGGKDAFVVLSLCVEALGPERVVPVYRYLVEGIRCVEVPIRAQLRMLGVTHPLVLVPAVHTLQMLQDGIFNKPQAIGDFTKRRHRITHKDIERLARKRAGCVWAASGEKQRDHVMRLLWLRTAAPEGICDKSHRIFPVHLWNQHHVRSYCTLRQAPLAPNFGGDITSGFGFSVLEEVKVRYPDDYARVIAAFPFAEALLARDKLYGRRPRSLGQKKDLDKRLAEIARLPTGDER
jgi:hypothetical protein